MSISVLNTDAGLSGKTIQNLEDGQTVTGLKTFDRDPNPPFAVTSGSAAVTNLDADKLDGLHGSAYYVKAVDGLVQLYTPAWAGVTVGNGTSTGSYITTGNQVVWIASLLCGSSTTFTPATNVVVTLPTGLAATTTHVAAATVKGYIMDATGPAYYPLTAAPSATTSVVLTTYASPAVAVVDTAPITFATGDVIVVGGTYFYA